MYHVDQNTIGQHLVNIVDESGRIIAMVCPWDNRAEEIARLMAAAPELYQASEKAYLDGFSDLGQGTIQALHAALNKADGYQ